LIIGLKKIKQTGHFPKMKQIAIVVPTIRPESLKSFLNVWGPYINKYNAELIVVKDGKTPKANGKTPKQVMGKYEDLIYNFNDGVRNLGFAYIAKYLPEVRAIITLDDDVLPLGDTIGTHIKVLNSRVPISWMLTGTRYTRGVPYGIRNQAEVVLSHGVWYGAYDYDAPSNLTMGNPRMEFYKGVIPRGVFYPMCGMNLAFKRKLLPYMYWAPMGPRVGIDRFADIWCGINSKKVIDAHDWAVVTGYAAVKHEKASNVFKNLQKEARGIELNEWYWHGNEEDPYFKLYNRQRKRWEKFINDC